MGKHWNRTALIHGFVAVVPAGRFAPNALGWRIRPSRGLNSQYRLRFARTSVACKVILYGCENNTKPELAHWRWNRQHFVQHNELHDGRRRRHTAEAEYGTLSDRELAVATGYEEAGESLVFLTRLGIASGLLLTGSDRAKMALTAGLTFIVPSSCW